jgi:superfamily II DNA helicase RecQ
VKQSLGFKEEIDDGLIGELKSWRSVVSLEKGVSAFVILSNKTIDEIARVMPKNALELSRVSGIGPGKLVEYGAKILEIVSEFGGGLEDPLKLV